MKGARDGLCLARPHCSAGGRSLALGGGVRTALASILAAGASASLRGRSRAGAAGIALLTARPLLLAAPRSLLAARAPMLAVTRTLLTIAGGEFLVLVAVALVADTVLVALLIEVLTIAHDGRMRDDARTEADG